MASPLRIHLFDHDSKESLAEALSDHIASGFVTVDRYEGQHTRQK